MVKIDLENMVDICGGRMTLKDIEKEIVHYLNCKQPERMVVTIEKNDKIKGYYTTIYIPIKDFEKPYK